MRCNDSRNGLCPPVTNSKSVMPSENMSAYKITQKARVNHSMNDFNIEFISSQRQEVILKFTVRRGKGRMKLLITPTHENAVKFLGRNCSKIAYCELHLQKFVLLAKEAKFNE